MINDWLMIIFTGVIAISTVIYTVFSYRLWKSTRATCDIARYTAFMTYLGGLAQEIDKSRERNPGEAAFLENFMSILAEAGFETFMKDIDLNKNPEAREFIVKLEGMFRGHGIDPMNIPMLRPIMNKSDTPRKAGGLMSGAASKAVDPIAKRRAKAHLICQI